MSETEQAWLRAEIMTQAPDRVIPTLWSLGAGGVEVRDEETFFESPDWVPVPEGFTRLIAYFEGTEQAIPHLRSTIDALPHAEPSGPSGACCPPTVR